MGSTPVGRAQIFLSKKRLENFSSFNTVVFSCFSLLRVIQNSVISNLFFVSGNREQGTMLPDYHKIFLNS